MDTTVQLGYIVQDNVSGFTGLVTTIGDHITGCERIGVYPVGDEPTGQRGSEEFFFEDQLTIEETDTEFSSAGENAQTSVEIDLGDTVQDTITGVEGTAVVLNYGLWSCPRVAIQPHNSSSVLNNNNSNEAPDLHWADIPRVEYVNDGVSDEFASQVSSTETATTGAVADTGSRVDSSSRL